MITTTSARFNAAMAQDHDIVSYFELWAPNNGGMLFSSQMSPTSGAILDGNVTLTKDQDARGQCSVTIVSEDLSLIPTTNTAPLTPWGNEIRIFSGVAFPDGTSEYVSMGYYRMSEVQINEQQGAVQLVVSGYDRSRNISRNVVQISWPDATAQAYFVANTTFPGNSWAAMIQQALTDRWPFIVYDANVTTWAGRINDPTASIFIYPALPGPFSEGTDMWDQMRQYAQAAGCDLWFDRYGTCQFQTDPALQFFLASFTPNPVALWVEGSTCNFDQLQRSLNDANVYNRAVVYGAGNILGLTLTSLVSYFSPAAQAANYVVGQNGQLVSAGVLADDNDPASPTFIGQVDTNPQSLNYGKVTGPSGFGVVTHIVNNNLLVSQTQVNNFAVLTLHLDIGASENVTFNSMLTDPRIEVDDCVMVDRTKAGITNNYYLVETLTIPLTMKEAMQATLREKRNLVH